MPEVHGRKYDRLYPKERQLLQKIKAGKTPKEAAKEVYATNGNEAAVAGRVFRRDRFLAAYEKAGLDAASLVKAIVEGVKANKTLFYNRQEFNPPDWFARLAFIKLVLKAQGVLDEDKRPDETNPEPLILKSVVFQQNVVSVNEPSTINDTMAETTIEGTITLTIDTHEGTKVTEAL